jgi:glycosyltransferase involved in cell wall biosynthesis
MKVGVCDFPSEYAFPPYGYGGIERWLWAAAVGAARSGNEVHLLGPGWRADLPVTWPRWPFRLEDLTPGSAAIADLRRIGLDLLIVGHEYPSLPRWRSVWEKLDCDVVTFQHDPYFRHSPSAFDGLRSRLWCYSTEMAERYSQHMPRQAPSIQFGLHEDIVLPAATGRDLIWLGRLDAQKAPHLAVMAARRLGRKLRVIGSPVRETAYFDRYRAALTSPHVELLGEMTGIEKTAALSRGRTLVYTCARDYVEAGAAIFGETLRAGTPIAALTWRTGTCAEAALCAQTGVNAVTDPETDDETAAGRLAEAILTADEFRAADVQQIGLSRYDPAGHFRALAGLSQ